MYAYFNSACDTCDFLQPAIRNRFLHALAAVYGVFDLVKQSTISSFGFRAIADADYRWEHDQLVSSTSQVSNSPA